MGKFTGVVSYFCKYVGSESAWGQNSSFSILLQLRVQNLLTYPCLVCPDSQSLCLHHGLACSVPGFQSPCSVSIIKAQLLVLSPAFLVENVCSKGKCNVNKYFSPPVYKCLCVKMCTFAFQVYTNEL